MSFANLASALLRDLASTFSRLGAHILRQIGDAPRRALPALHRVRTKKVQIRHAFHAFTGRLQHSLCRRAVGGNRSRSKDRENRVSVDSQKVLVSSLRGSDESSHVLMKQEYLDFLLTRWCCFQNRQARVELVRTCCINVCSIDDALEQ